MAPQCIAEICRELAARTCDLDKYITDFPVDDRYVRRAVTQFKGTKTDLRYDFSSNAESLLRVSLVMSDLTTLFLVGGEERSVILAGPESTVCPFKVSAPTDLIEKHEIETQNGVPNLRPGHTMRRDQLARQFMHGISSLVENGLVLPRPEPILLALRQRKEDIERRTWEMIHVDPHDPSSIWIVEPLEACQASIPLRAHADCPKPWQGLADVMVPYLVGVSLDDLGKILLDEHDLIADFRSNIGAMIRSVSEGDTEVRDVFNDGVRPSVDRVNRKFKDIVAVRSLRLAGAGVSCVCLGLLSLCGIEAISSSMALGAGGLGVLLAREYAEFVKEKRELRNEPLYLLWRIGRSWQGA